MEFLEFPENPEFPSEFLEIPENPEIPCWKKIKKFGNSGKF